MAVMWADSALTGDVDERLDYPYPVKRYTIGNALYALYLKGHLVRERQRRCPWEYQAACPLVEYLAIRIAELLAASPDRARTVRVAFANQTDSVTSDPGQVRPRS